LLQHGDAVTSVASQCDRTTALLVAASYGRAACVQLLLQHVGAAVLGTDNHGATALMLATRGGHVACVKLLLQHGDAESQVAAKCNEGTTALSESILRWSEARRRPAGDVEAASHAQCALYLLAANAPMGSAATK